MTTTLLSDMITTIDALGTNARTEVEFVKELNRKGAVDVSVIDGLERLADVSAAGIQQLIPRRTVDNARARGSLTPQLAERIAMAVEIVHLAHRTFGSRDIANRWLQKPNRGLEGERPWALLRSGPGANLVRDTLLRIEHGVYG